MNSHKIKKQGRMTLLFYGSDRKRESIFVMKRAAISDGRDGVQ